MALAGSQSVPPTGCHLSIPGVNASNLTLIRSGSDDIEDELSSQLLMIYLRISAAIENGATINQRITLKGQRIILNINMVSP
jgi:hypothetical protein